MPEENAGESTDLWTSILDLLSKIITPDWGDVIGWLPLLTSGLVVLVLLYIAYRWWRAGDLNRSRVAPRLTTGAPPPGVHMPGPSRWPFVVPVGGALILFALAIRPTDSSGQPTAPLNWPVLAVGLAVTGVAIFGWLRDAMREWRQAEGVEGPTATLVTASGASAALSPGLRVSAFPTRRVPAVGAATGAGHTSAAVAQAAAEREPPPGVHIPGPSPWPFLAPIALAVVFFGLVFSPAIVLGGIVMGLIAAGGWLRDAGYEFRQVDAGHAPEPRTRDPERAFPKVMLGVYAAIGLLSLALIVAPRIVAFANQEPAPSGAAGGGGGGAPSSQVSISADRLEFSVDEFRVPAESPFTITFENKEAAPHNVAIYPNSQLTEALFMGEIITGPNTITYNVSPLTTGEYYFVCNVHPNMNGAVIAQ